MAEESPLLFTAHLGMLKPANRAAEEAMQEVRGKVRVTIKGGVANEKRRSLYWSVASLVVPLLNEAHSLTLDETDLHSVTRTKLKLYDEQVLPSGEVYRKLRGTNNRAMSEPERAEFTNRALALWSTWLGIPVETLKRESEQ